MLEFASRMTDNSIMLGIVNFIYTEEQIGKAIFEARSLYLTKIVRHYDGYIILAQNEKDYNSKLQCIQRGDTKGFYTVERALSGRF